MATEVRFEVASEAHVRELVRTMRAADAAECWASCGVCPEAALRASMAASDFTHALLFGGRVAALYGAAPLPSATLLGSSGAACAWALTSGEVDAHPRDFLRASRLVLGLMQGRYRVLFNHVDARYPAALRWAARIGFTVGPAEAFGPAGLPFHRITLERS